MRLRAVAAAAAGVVAAIGLSAHDAAAEPVDQAVDESSVETHPQDTSTPSAGASEPDAVSKSDRRKLAEAAAALAESEKRPPGDGPVRSEPPRIIAFEETVEAAPPPVTPQVAAPAKPTPEPATTSTRTANGSTSRPDAAPRRTGSPRTAAPAPVTAARAPASPDPTHDKSAPSPAAPVQNAVIAKNTDTAPKPKATPPADFDPVSAGDEWYPAWATDLADQRIAEKWRTAPVRGPPPGAATALGNSSTNTVTQVAVVRGRFGTEAVVTMQSQTSDVSNIGTATAEAHGAGSANATGNTASTSVIQVSVIVVRGTGTATIEQTADVDNVGSASATTAGAANATAVGNDSSTTVTQVAVVYIEGSGDAHVNQTTEVDNVGIASAEVTDRSATATGNQSTTDVTQVSVVHVGNEDASVSQTSNTTNFGVASANGGTASGNTATNTTVQVAKVPRANW